MASDHGGEFVGRNIVVAAAGRKLGKTLLSSALAEALSHRGLKTAFFKLRQRRDPGSVFTPGEGRKNSDTWRVKQAGASETGLFSYGSDCDLSVSLPAPPPDSDAVIWETNSAAEIIPEAVLVYIHGDVDEPKNPELADTAAFHIDGPLSAVSSETTGLILSFAGFSGFNPVLPGWKLWLQIGNDPIFGGGIASLLEAIRKTGSILAASRSTGIQYRRVWTLVSRTEKKIGVRLIHRSRGGSGGGGSTLTPVADMLLNRFHFLENSMARAASELEEENR